MWSGKSGSDEYDSYFECDGNGSLSGSYNAFVYAYRRIWEAGYMSGFSRLSERLRKALQKRKIEFDFIFVGYLGNCDMVDGVLDFIRHFPKAKVVTDTIMGDNGEFYGNFDSSYLQAVKKLLAFSDLILPNYTEACFLAGMEYRKNPSQTYQNELCERLMKLGAKDMVITSVTAAEGTGILYCEKGKKDCLYLDCEPHNIHGTGDVFDGVILGNCMRGLPLKENIVKAHQFVKTCIAETYRYDYNKREGVLLEKMLPMLV